MSTTEWILVVALAVAVAAVAHLLGKRSGREARAKSAAAEAAEAEASDPAPAPDSKEEISRLEYEEDSDVDPTKVGAAAAPPREVVQAPLKRIYFDEDAEADEPTQAQSVFLVSATAQTDKGMRRKRNEDSLLVLEKQGLFVVADGMGGYKGGALASKLAVTTIGDAFTRGQFEGPPHKNVPRQATELARAMQSANAVILETAKQKEELEGMGTTVVAALFSPNKQRLYIGHVGDSRCYRLRNGVLSQMTADHTMAELGAKGPESQQLSRAVGIWPTVPIDVVFAVPLPGDVYLLCSDGLTKMLPDDLIGTVLRNEEDPKAAVDRLIFFTNARGGKDNVTVLLVRVVPPNWKPKPSEPFEWHESPSSVADVVTIPPPKKRPG